MRLQPLEAHVVVGLRSQLSVPGATELISETSPSTLVSPGPLMAHRDAVMAASFSTKAWIRSQWGCGGSSCCLWLRRCKFFRLRFLPPQYRKTDGTFSLKMDLCGPAVVPGNHTKNVDQSRIRSNCRSLVVIVPRLQQQVCSPQLHRDTVG